MVLYNTKTVDYLYERSLHMFFSPFVLHDVFLFYYNYLDFLSIRKKMFILPAFLHHPLCPFSIGAYDITLAGNEEIREAER